MEEQKQVKHATTCPRCGFMMFIKNRLVEDFSQPPIPVGYLCMNCYAFKKEIEYEAKIVNNNEV